MPTRWLAYDLEQPERGQAAVIHENMDTGQCGTSPHVSHAPHYFPAVLAKDGHQIILEQIEDWNLVELVVNEETVFQCDIQELEFGKAGEASVQ